MGWSIAQKRDRSNRCARQIRLGTALAALCVLYAAIAYGQATNSGDITGTVTDSTGAILPGVSITLLDVDKNVTHTYTTNEAGAYDTGPIVPDHYILTFAKEGFATYKRGPITVSVGVVGINVEMTVGGTSQQVVVTSEVPLLETASAEVSSTIPSETLTELPQVGGLTPDWTNFIALQPGTAGTAQVNNSAINGGMQSSANGSLPYSTGLMDGMTASSPMSDNVIMTPIFDAIAEVKMSDSLFSAQYGLGGVLYNQITKGGTDHYHGMFYDYFQNNALNAAPYTFSGPKRASFIRYHDLGGQIGGPIPIPHFQKRVFAFFAMERAINHGAANPGTISLPDTNMMNGDFSGAGMPTLYDPTTQTYDPVTGALHRVTFASEYGGKNAIPAKLIDPVAKSIQDSYFPKVAPSGAGIPQNNYSYLLSGTKFPVVKYFGRFDADITPTNRMTGSSAWANGWPGFLSPICPINCLGIDVMNSNSQLSDVWTISPHLVNEARLGFMEEHDQWIPESYNKGIPAKLGIKWTKADEFPVITILNMYGLAPGSNGYYVSNVFDPSDVLTVVWGRHTLHTGGEVLIELSNSTSGNQTPVGHVDPGEARFDGFYTSSDGTGKNDGTPYADFLLGLSDNWQASYSPEFGARMKIPQLFVQDDWKVNSKLTMNLGIRWVGATGWSDIRNNILSFDPTITNPATNTLGAMWYASTHANGRTTVQKPVWNGFLPRIGLAYQLGQKTTIRGGWGIYTYAWSFDNYGVGVGQAVSFSGSQQDKTKGALPVAKLNDDGNTNYQGSAGSSINSLYLQRPTTPSAYNGQNVTYEQYDAPFAKLQQWNFTIQRQLTNDTMVQVGYVGSHGSDLLYKMELNEVPQSKLGTGAFPYPQYGAITGNKAVATSNYHSLQAVATRRMSSGFMVTANYTWSKFLDDQDTAGWNSQQGAEPFQNSYDPHSNYGPSNFDVRHALKGQAIYQLPFGKGHQLLNTSGLLDQVIGGWQLSGTWQISSGTPVTPVMALDKSGASPNIFASGHSQFPNVVGNLKASGSSGTISQWYSRAALADPGANAYGNERRNSVFGPKLLAFNASLHKVFAIGEKVNLDFMANCLNVPNHASFGPPNTTYDPNNPNVHGQITSVSNNARSFELAAKLKF